MSTSMKLPPTQDAFFRLFVRSQLLVTHKAPPSDLNLEGQTAIITGGNSGLGLEAARVLLSYHLSRLVLTVRNTEKAAELAAQLRKDYPSATIEFWRLDMLSYNSIRVFAKQCSTLDRIDFAILNAGVSSTTFRLNESTKHEEVTQVNYLSTMLLCILLLPVLKERHPPGIAGRITIVTSVLARVAAFQHWNDGALLRSLDDPAHFEMNRYATSKLLGQMFLAKLGDFVSADDVVVNTVEPGMMKKTGLDRNQPTIVQLIVRTMRLLVGRSLQAGAWTYVDAAVVQDKLSHASFLFNWEIYPFPTWMYSDEGKEVTERLWGETMDELDFAGARSILDAMKKCA